jgi:hypothetical protein
MCVCSKALCATGQTQREYARGCVAIRAGVKRIRLPVLCRAPAVPSPHENVQEQETAPQKPPADTTNQGPENPPRGGSATATACVGVILATFGIGLVAGSGRSLHNESS